MTANGNFKIKEDGSIETTNGKFTGEVDARSGNIGGFGIANGRIGVERGGALSSENGLTITGSYIRVGNNGCYGAIGSDMAGSIISGGVIQYAGYFNNTSSNWLTPGGVPPINYGVSIKTQNSNTCIGMDITTGNSEKSIGVNFNIQGTKQYAFCGNGIGVLRGLMEGYRLNTMVFTTADEVQTIDIKNGKYIMLGVTGSGCSVLLPTLSNLREALNISDGSSDIAVRLTIYCRWSNYNIRLVGRRHIDGNSWEYPLLRDNNNNDNWSTTMTAGDIIELLLTYCYAEHEDSYNAYILSHMH